MTQYVIVRRDLPLGLLAAQIAHAAGAFRQHPPGTHVVVLGVDDEAELDFVAERLWNAGITHSVIDEDEGPFAGQRTAISLDLISDRSRVRKILSSLPLLK